MSHIPAFETKIGLSHNTQKPLQLIEYLIEIFTDENDIVIDPVAGSAVTLLAAGNLNRRAYGFEIKKEFCKQAHEKILTYYQKRLFTTEKIERYREVSLLDK